MDQNYQGLLDMFCDILLRENASDLHLASGRRPYMRIKTDLLPLEQYDVMTPQDVYGILSVLVSQQKMQSLVQGGAEIDFSYDYQGKLRLRGNAYLRMGTISIALRTIREVKTLESLGLPAILKSVTQKRQGFFLVVGPVGQGKSTTLAAMIDEINSNRSEHIVTIESPIEYIFQEKKSIIDQREVGNDTQSFEAGLTNAFREDINVIMIGEMRSRDTIATAVTAAETGHLVFSTLHTNNAAQTIDRIVDSFPSEQQRQIRTQLAASLIGILSQRLVPTMQGGLVPVCEYMMATPAVENLIREGKTYELPSVIETSREHGMIDMNQSLLDLVQAGKISMDDARRYAVNVEAFDSRAQGR